MNDLDTSGATPLHDQVCLAVEAVRDRAPGAEFVLRRACAEVGRAGGPGAAALSRVLRVLADDERREPDWSEALGRSLVRAGGAFERQGRYAAARRLYELAMALRPGCAKTALHAGRAARLSGDREAALAHYARVEALDGTGRLARLARIGTAMLAQGERSLSREIRRALEAGDHEAAGVGLEARAIVRCETARCREAVRDLCVCALRYPDREDRARAAARVAALLARSDDLDAAREALLLVHEIGTPEQREAARAELHALALASGDALGARRWAPHSRQEQDGVHPPVSLPKDPGEEHARLPRATRLSLPMIRGWRDAVERSAGAR